jgi:hypothetical protein
MATAQPITVHPRSRFGQVITLGLPLPATDNRGEKVDGQGHYPDRENKVGRRRDVGARLEGGRDSENTNEEGCREYLCRLRWLGP